MSKAEGFRLEVVGGGKWIDRSGATYRPVVYSVSQVSVCIIPRACEKLTNAEKARIPDLHFSGFITMVNCIMRSFWPFCCCSIMMAI